jgi:transcriptional regulatory protein AMDR
MGRSACVICHQRKVRCDAHVKGFPCSNCISSGKSDCRIHQKKRRAIPRSVNNPIPICSRSSTAAISSSRSSQSLQPLQNGEGSPAGPQLQVIDEEYQGGIDRSSDNLAHPSGSEGRAIHKGVRITYVGKDVSNISFLVRQRLEGQNERVYHFPSEGIAKKYLRHESDRVPQEAFMLPDKALADELITAYFTHVNPGCPILNEEIFMAQYAGHNPADPPSLLVLQAVLLVGAHILKDRPERDSWKAIFFRRAKMLFEARVEWNRDHMVQAALLLTWYSDGVEDVAANAWYWVGTAARIATGK